MRIEASESSRGRYRVNNLQEYAIRDGETQTIELDSESYYVITEIPDTDDSRRAVTTTKYEPVNLDLTENILLIAEWANNWGTAIDYRQALSEAKEKAAEFQAYETISRAIDLGITALETYALANVNPSLAIDSAADLFFESVSWAYDTVTDPYEEGFQKITRVIIENRDIQRQADQIQRISEFPALFSSLFDAAHGLSQAVVGAGKVGSAWGSTITQYGLKTSLTTPLQASAGRYTINAFAGMVINTTIEETIDGAISTNAKIAAAAHAYAVAKIPITEYILEIEQKRKSGEITPGEIVALQRYKMAYFQLGSLLFEITSKYYGEMSELWAGRVYDIVGNADENESQHRQLAENLRSTAKLQLYALGKGIERVRGRTENSINAELLRDQAVAANTDNKSDNGESTLSVAEYEQDGTVVGQASRGGNMVSWDFIITVVNDGSSTDARVIVEVPGGNIKRDKIISMEANEEREVVISNVTYSNAEIEAAGKEVYVEPA